MKTPLVIIGFTAAILLIFLQMISEPTYVDNPELGVIETTVNSEPAEWDNAYDVNEFNFIDQEPKLVQELVETELRKRYYISYSNSPEDVFNALVQYQRENGIYIIDADLDTINLGKLDPLTARALDIAIY